MFDRLVLITGQRNADRGDERVFALKCLKRDERSRGMTALLSLYCEEEREQRMEGKKRGKDTVEIIGKELSKIHSVLAQCCVCVLVRHIPPGSDAVIHRDPQTTRRSRVSQALTFDEKI